MAASFKLRHYLEGDHAAQTLPDLFVLLVNTAVTMPIVRKQSKHVVRSPSAKVRRRLAMAQ